MLVIVSNKTTYHLHSTALKAIGSTTDILELIKTTGLINYQGRISIGNIGMKMVPVIGRTIRIPLLA